MSFVAPLDIQWKFAHKLYKNWTEDREELKGFLRKVGTPTLVIRRSLIKQRYEAVKKYFSNFKVYYAVKANDNKGVIEDFAKWGAGFEVASIAELQKVLNFKVSPDRVISSNPVKPLEFIDFCLQHGIDRFAVDSIAEIDKIARFKRRARIYVRIAVPNVGSDWPLSRKFGVDTSTAVNLIEYANEKGLIPYGITFHVGSQCNNLQNWFIAIKKAKEVWDRLGLKGIKLQMLNIGGGIPARYTRESLSIKEISSYIKGLLNKYFNIRTLELQMEPGRGLVAEAGILVTSIIGKAERFGEKWIYIDSGVFHGLAEALGGIRYSFFTDKENPEDLEFYTIGGISCDGMDVVAEKVALPKNIKVGEKLYILTAGAYTTVYASHFNGFPPPKVLLID